MKRVALLALALVCVAPARAAVPVKTAPVSIVAYSCAKDESETPHLGIGRMASLNEISPLASDATRLGPGRWSIRTTVPLGRWAIFAQTAHCAGYFDTVSVDGEARTFATALYEDDRGPLDHQWRHHYIAVVLPFDAETEVYASKDGSPVDAEQPARSGRYLYFEGLPRDKYVVVVRIFLYAIAIPIDLSYAKPETGYVVRISDDDVRKVIACPVLEHCDHATIEDGP